MKITLIIYGISWLILLCIFLPDFVNASPKSMESDCSVKKRLYGEVLLR